MFLYNTESTSMIGYDEEATTMDELSDVLTPDGAGRLLHLHPRTVVRKAAAGELPGIKLGGRWRFSREQLMRFIETGELPDRRQRRLPSVARR
jgi:excisionase family DNA binding protein